MKKFKSAALATVLTIAASNVYAYNVVDRYKLIDDKLKTEQMLRPYGHDFFLDIGVAMNKNAKQLVTDISDAGKATSPLTAAQGVLTKYDKTEQTLKLNLNLGIPIFKFSAWNVKVQPNLRVFADAGANLGIRSQTITPQLLLDLINVTIPNTLKSAILAATYVGGDDILAPASNPNLCDSLSTPEEIAACKSLKGKYFYPTNTNIPNLLMFAKLDAKIGLYNDYTYEDHFFGNLNLYLLNRTDIYQLINANMIANGAKIDLPKKRILKIPFKSIIELVTKMTIIKFLPQLKN